MADNPSIFDNSLAGTQRLIAATSGVLTLQNSGSDNGFSIGPSDSDDYFKLTVSRSSNVVVKLNPEGGNLSLSVLDSTGTPILGRTTNNPNGLAEAVISDTIDPLQPGQEYYIRVSGSSATDVNYTLTVDTSPTSRADLFWQNVTAPGLNSVWRMNDTTLTSFDITKNLVPPPWLLAGIGDFDRDGADDLLWHNLSDGSLAFWLMEVDGLTVRSEVFLPSVAGNWYVGGFGDFGGDSGLDIVWRDNATGYTGVWIMNGTSFVSVVDIDNLSDPSWNLSAVTDFNLDGEADLFFRNFSTGENVIWLMNDTSFSAAESFISIAPTWEMSATGDFDGDGDQDLLWHDRRATGLVVYWYLDQTEYVSSVVISTIGLEYTVAGVIDNIPPSDLAGNNPGAAFSIGKLDATATYSDSIGRLDSQDFYAFRLDSASKVGINAFGTGFSAQTEIDVLTADGSTILGSTTASGADREVLTDLNLDPGSYLIRVKSSGTGDTRYVIDVSGEELGSNLLFPTAPPDITTFKRLDGTTFSSTTPVSVRDPFTFDLDYTVTYTGSRLNQFEVGFYLSKDGTLDATDLRFDLNSDGIRNGSDVAQIAGTSPDTRITRTQRLTLPKFDDPFWSDRGSTNSYRIIIVLDPENKIPEVDPTTRQPAEGDNTFAAPIQIEAFRPDIVPENFNVTQTVAARGGQIDLSGLVRNIGTAKSDAGRPAGTTFEVRFYLSRDNVFNTSAVDAGDRDFQLTTTPRPITIGVLDIGAQASIGTGVIANLPNNWAGYRANQPGSNYYILMVADASGTLNEISGGTVNNSVFDVITIPFS
ncbi:MAG: FG-GAP-like repeat-containing protein [Leptolyngbyaceae cyanobacterium bins.302]|nr:FG-GAP-like repeat-containing protein [Leptolyngbyaceae cyanobacterium bins.302]